MCYSAQTWAAYRKYVKAWGAEIDMQEFLRLYGFRAEGAKVRTPKAMDAEFLRSTSPAGRAIAALIEAHDREQLAALESGMFAQRKRLAEAERTLAVKPTKKALNDRRIATGKISQSLARMADIRRVEPRPKDSRIFPGSHVPVMVMEGGRRIVRPMRYQCRPAGKPASHDVRYPGTYNARRDNLERFWKGQFGSSHGVIVVERFYENVERIDADGNPHNLVLEFSPQDGSAMIVACLWSHWTDPQGRQPDLLSFAAITDDPPPEIAAAGHDRCIIPIKPENLDAWLQPDPADLGALQAILDDRARPHYEHRLAA